MNKEIKACLQAVNFIYVAVFCQRLSASGSAWMMYEASDHNYKVKQDFIQDA